MTIYLTYGIKTKIKLDWVKRHLNYPDNDIISVSDLKHLIENTYNIKIDLTNESAKIAYPNLEHNIFLQRIINSIKANRDIYIILTSIYLKKSKRDFLYDYILKNCDISKYNLIILDFNYKLEDLISINNDISKYQIIELYNSQEPIKQEELEYLKTIFKSVEIKKVCGNNDD